ncbi:glycosyltransferase [Pengzhenrongella frigida]|uniref:D-inositol 3-phosphate glycosyltransferase n=1 Tax=Pengzhenrongella frigida TaxID=1259133 RepID=A0A4Q5MY21_9MICO|nr:glycosyltransferase [Cellulomonas sp. HLT2-17]
MGDPLEAPDGPRLRVLQVLGSSAGGVARHVAQIAAALAAPVPNGLGAMVRVAGPAALGADLAPTGGPVTFRAVAITDRPRPGDAGVVLRLRALAAGADVVHAHGLRAGTLVVLATRMVRAPRPRVVVTLHNLPVGGRAVRGVSALLELVVARGADVVLGVSGDLVERSRARGARGGERALVPAPSRPHPNADRAAVRRELALTDDTALVVTVGRLAPQKGLDTLLDAAVELGAAVEQGAADRHVLWAVAGDGPLEEHLAERSARLAAPVRLLGRRGDVPDLFAAADVVVSTAVWEGQPIGIQEALQLGAPVVATDAGGTREVTGDRGAVLVPVGDATAIAAAVARLLADPGERAALAAQARARAAELPDLADVVDQLRRVYAR